MSKILVDTIDTRSGTTTLTLGSSNAGTIALGSGDVQSNFLQPSFHAQKTDSQQSINNASFTKLTFNNEIFDTDNKFADSRFTPTIAGKYFIYGAWGTNTSAEITQMQCVLYKNGTTCIGQNRNHRTHVWKQIGNTIPVCGPQTRVRLNR